LTSLTLIPDDPVDDDQTRSAAEANAAGPRRGLFSLFSKRFDEHDSSSDNNKGRKVMERR
jgi:hypothetical protein